MNMNNKRRIKLVLLGKAGAGKSKFIESIKKMIPDKKFYKLDSLPNQIEENIPKEEWVSDSLERKGTINPHIVTFSSDRTEYYIYNTVGLEEKTMYSYTKVIDEISLKFQTVTAALFFFDSQENRLSLSLRAIINDIKYILPLDNTGNLILIFTRYNFDREPSLVQTLREEFDEFIKNKVASVSFYKIDMEENLNDEAKETINDILMSCENMHDFQLINAWKCREAMIEIKKELGANNQEMDKYREDIESLKNKKNDLKKKLELQKWLNNKKEDSIKDLRSKVESEKKFYQEELEKEANFINGEKLTEKENDIIKCEKDFEEKKIFFKNKNEELKKKLAQIEDEKKSLEDAIKSKNNTIFELKNEQKKKTK